MATDGSVVKITGGGTQFQWFRTLGATEEAVMVLNDQPVLFTILLVVLVTLILHGVLLWYIHHATLKPEQMKKKKEAKPAEKKSGGGVKGFFPAALRR